MSATLEERLAKIERADEELRQYFLRAMQADTSLYVGDFLILGALKRTLALSAGFRGHIRDRNFTCAGALLRLQLDTALRLYAGTLYKNPQEYAEAVFKGARVDKLKDKHGKRLTDAYLADKLSEQSTQRSNLGTAERMHAWSSIFHSSHMEHASFEINLVPTQRTQLGYAQAVAIADENHC